MKNRSEVLRNQVNVKKMNDRMFREIEREEVFSSKAVPRYPENAPRYEVNSQQ